MRQCIENTRRLPLIRLPRLAGLLALAVLSPAIALCQETVQTPTTVKTFAPADFVMVQQGELPLILSAPHGGTMLVPDVQPREGEGQARTPGNFVTARDSNTTELAQAISGEIERRYGKKPFLVASLAHRKYLDPNRPADLAYEHPNAEAVFKLYHRSLDSAVKQVFDTFHTGLLLDVHGQGSRSDTVFRGTKNGLTVKLLKERHGTAAHEGPASLFGLLAARGWHVHPTPHDQPEQAGFTGGYIVQTYGSHQNTGIDAIQLEFGSQYRAPANAERTASDLVDALSEYGSLYLKLPSPSVAAKQFPNREFLTTPPEKETKKTSKQ